MISSQIRKIPHTKPSIAELEVRYGINAEATVYP
jgi:hypothetical protein